MLVPIFSPQMYYKRILFLLCCSCSNFYWTCHFVSNRKSKLCLICCWNCGSRVTWMQLCKCRVSSLYIRFQLFKSWIPLIFYWIHQINYHHCHSLKIFKGSFFLELYKTILFVTHVFCLSFITIAKTITTTLTNQSSRPNYRPILCHH